MIDILRNIGGVEQVVCRVAHDNATVIGEIMAREEVNIDVVVDAPLNLAVGDYVRVDDTVYTLNRETSFDKKSEVEYRYDLLFESPLYRLLDKLFVHPITGLSTFTISRTLAEWLKLVVDCINEIDPGWTVAVDIPQIEPKNLPFDSTSCREALNRFVSEFGVEFFLVRKEIHFVNRIENETDLVFEQGKGKGLYTISQEPVDNENTITRILAYGGSQNVAPGEGDAKGRLCLPEKYLENFSEYSKIVEKEVEFKDIFPKFSGSADSVSGEFNRIITCSTIDFDIAAQAIGGTPVKINILTGDLMGESFEFGWKNEIKEITLIRREDETALPGQDGKKPLIPSESRSVKAGDSFNFTDLNMPTSYKENAVIWLRRKATEWLAYYSRSRVKFTLEVDHRYLRGKHVLKAGDLVTIKIPETGINKLLRITSIERNLKTGKMNCTVSNYLDEKWKKKIEGAISDLKSTVGGGNAGGGGSTFEIIKLNDLAVPSDKNVFSSLRTLAEIKLNIQELDNRFLRKDVDDTAHGNILFDKRIGSSVFLDGYDGKGWSITQKGAAMLDSTRVRADIYIGGKFGSPSFASGFMGWGVEIDIPTATGTFDFLTARKSMKVYELVYSQIYGLGGSVIVSDLNKILYVETCQGFYRCYMDSMDGTMRMNLRKDDIVRMQRSLGINIRYFYGEVLDVTPDYFDLKVTDGEDYPQLGDVVFRFGNKTDKNRQGIIYLTSSDDNAPYLDILDGITDSSMFEKVKVRIGNVAGIRTKSGIQLEGYRIYAQGAVFEDTDIYLEDGTTVAQQFIIMNGKFESTIEGIRNDMSIESGNILRNSSFGSNLNYWKSTNSISFINIGSSFLWIDGSFYSDKRSVADIYRDGNKNVLRILGTTIVQSNDIFDSKKEGTYSFSFYYKVLRDGTLSAGFSGKKLFATESLKVSDKYQKMYKVAQWDGTGDFSISFTGEILIYGVSLFNDALADAQIKLQTQIDQTAEYIKLLAKKEYVDAETGKIYIRYNASLTVMAEEIAARVTKIDFDTATGTIREEISSQISVQAGRITAISTDVNNVKRTIDTSGWINTTQGNTLFASKTLEDGNKIISYINQSATSTIISSNRINLYGAVTFSMLHGTLQNTVNGKVDANTLGDLAYMSVISKGLLNSSLQSEINGAMQQQTYISGGLIKASMIDVDNLYAKKLAAKEGTVGAFAIDISGALSSFDNNSDNHLFLRGPGLYTENKPLIDMTVNGSHIRLGESKTIVNGAPQDEYIFKITGEKYASIYKLTTGVLETGRLKIQGITSNTGESGEWKPLYINTSTKEVKYKY